MVTGSKDTCIKKWEIKIPKERPTIYNEKDVVILSSTRTQKTHEKDINTLCISKNMKLLATGSLDRTAKVSFSLHS